MLKILEKLLPNFEKRRVLSQCDNLSQQITEILLPIISNENERLSNYSNWSTSSKTAKTIEVELKRDLRGTFKSVADSKHYASLFLFITEELGKKTAILKEFAKKEFEERVATNGMNFKQLQILRMIELGSFYVNYTLKLLDQIAWEECEAGAIKGLDKPLTPAELKWLDDNHQTYLRLCKIYAMKDNDFTNVIAKTSELVVAEVDDEQASVLSGTTNPFQTNYVPFISDISLTILSGWMEYQNSVYEKNKLRLKVVQLRLLLLKQKQEEGKVDPSITRQIDYYTDQVKKLEKRIDDYEKKAGVKDE